MIARQLCQIAAAATFACVVGCRPGAIVVEPVDYWGGGKETSVASQRVPGLLPLTTVGFNDFHKVYGDTISGYAYIRNRSRVDTCNFDAGPRGVGACAPIFFEGPDAPTFQGDPAVAADGRGGVVYVSIATTDPVYPNMIVASASGTGGATWGPVPIRVNDDRCNFEVDNPNAIFDTSVSPPVLHVVWRGRDRGQNFGICYRAGLFEQNVISFPHPTVVVPRAQIDQDDPNVGSPLVRAQGGTASVVYQTSFGSPGVTSSGACPADANTKSVGWAVSSTSDFGASWPIQHGDVIRANNHDTCVVSKMHEVGFRAFGAAVTDTGRLWVAAQVDGGHIQTKFSDDLSNWNDGPLFGAAENGGVSLLHPALAWNGHLLLTYYLSDPTDTTVARFATGSAFPEAKDTYVSTFLETQGLPVTLEPSTMTGIDDRLFGDYADVTAVIGMPNVFYASWNAHRSTPPSPWGTVFATTRIAFE